MVSHRKRKREAAALGLSERELEFATLLEELLDHVRWQQILGYTNQFLLAKHVGVSTEERDRILEASTRAVDKDARLHEWRERLARLKGEIVAIKRSVRRARRDIARGVPAPESATSDGDGIVVDGA